MAQMLSEYSRTRCNVKAYIDQATAFPEYVMWPHCFVSPSFFSSSSSSFAFHSDFIWGCMDANGDAQMELMGKYHCNRRQVKEAQPFCIKQTALSYIHFINLYPFEWVFSSLVDALYSVLSVVDHLPTRCKCIAIATNTPHKWQSQLHSLVPNIL